MQVYKPGSVTCLHRPLSFIYAAPRGTALSIYPQDSHRGESEPLSGHDPGPAGDLILLLGLATPQVYHARHVAMAAVGPYPTISPLPRQAGAVSFLLHFLYSGKPEPFPLGRRALFVARTFLFGHSQSDRATCILPKIRKPRYQTINLSVGLLNMTHKTW